LQRQMCGQNVWDGVDQRTKRVCESGLYFYLAKAGEVVTKGKFSIIR